MGYLCVTHKLFYILVAVIAKVLAFRLQHVAVISRMGVVTQGTILGSRLVLVLQFELGLPVQVAEETQLRTLELNHPLEIRRVGIVADVTVASGHRAVNYLSVGLVILMT